MWIKTKCGDLINSDWISWIEIYSDFNFHPHEYELRVHFIKGGTDWAEFGKYEKVEEVILERDKLKELLEQ